MNYYPRSNCLDLTPQVSGIPSFGEDLSPEMANDFYDYFLGIRALDLFNKTAIKPNVLFIEPHNMCQLRCTYCYAETMHLRTGHKLSPERVKELYDKYQFNEVRIFGGDIFADWKLAKKVIEMISGVDHLFFSTNGLGLTDERISFIKSHCKKLSIQISLEPKEWNKRVTINPLIHQNDKLDHLKNLKDTRFTFNITIPTNVPGKLSNSLIPYHKELEDLLGHGNYSASWQMESGSDATEIPPYAQGWLLEAELELQDSNYSFREAIKSIFAAQMGHIFSVADGVDSSIFPGYFYNCNAGMGSISVGPDGLLYTCHEEGVVENNKFNIKEESTVRSLFEKMKKDTQNMSNDECRKCRAHYMCGGICYTRRGPVKCEFERLCVDLAIKAMLKFDAHRSARLAVKQREVLNNFKTNYESFKEIIRGETWKKLQFGVLPIEEVADLAKSFLGISVNLDTPLWELPGHGMVS